MLFPPLPLDLAFLLITYLYTFTSLAVFFIPGESKCG